MVNFREQLKRKLQAEIEGKNKKRDAEKFERIREHEKIQQRHIKEKEIFERLTPMVSEPLKTLGDEIWGRKFFLFKRYTYKNKIKQEAFSHSKCQWVLRHYLKSETRSYFVSNEDGSRSDFVKYFEGYTIELIFSDDIEPSHFIINKGQHCPISREQLEQELLRCEPYTWTE